MCSCVHVCVRGPKVDIKSFNLLLSNLCFEVVLLIEPELANKSRLPIQLSLEFPVSVSQVLELQVPPHQHLHGF